MGIATFLSAPLTAAWVPDGIRRSSQPFRLQDVVEAYRPIVGHRPLWRLYS
jgi:hypothetical protein